MYISHVKIKLNYVSISISMESIFEKLVDHYKDRFELFLQLDMPLIVWTVNTHNHQTVVVVHRYDFTAVPVVYFTM